MALQLERYVEQLPHWPYTGREILAQFDEETIIVYQAYRPEIGLYAARNGTFGGEFSFSRMTWIKPNFLWMMFRSGWGTKKGQEVTLAIRVRRTGFDAILREAIPSSFSPEAFDSERTWRAAGESSSGRMQWDPDHDPSGAPLGRRAIQLGVRGETLARFVNEWIVSIEDVSELVASQRARPHAELLLPRERACTVSPDLRIKLGMAESGATANGQRSQR